MAVVCSIVLTTLAPKLGAHADDPLPPDYKPHPALQSLKSWEIQGYKSPEQPVRYIADIEPGGKISSALEKAHEDLLRPGDWEGTESIWYDINRRVLLIGPPKLPPTSRLLGSNNKIDSSAPPLQSWVITLDKKPKPLFYTYQEFGYRWLNQRFVIAYGSCESNSKSYRVGQGLYLIDSLYSRIKLVDKKFVFCPSNNSFLLSSPNSRMIAFGDIVFNPFTRTQRKVCEAGQFTRSAVWTKNSRYLYVACAQDKAMDALRKYDAKTGRVSTLATQSQLSFVAGDLWLSKDDRFLLFYWADAPEYLAEESYGVWVIDLAKLKPQTVR